MDKRVERREMELGAQGRAATFLAKAHLKSMPPCCCHLVLIGQLRSIFFGYITSVRLLVHLLTGILCVSISAIRNWKGKADLGGFGLLTSS